MARTGRKKISPLGLWVIIGILVIMLNVVIVISFRKINTVQKESAEIHAQLDGQIQQNMRSGYVALTAINQGDLLADGINVQFSTQIPSNVDAASFATSEIIGKEALVDIPLGVPIMTTMVAEKLPESFTEKECTFIHLSANLLEGDYVDVRVVFPNGEDYIVASKKAVKKPIITSNLVYLWLTEEEINSLDASVVDANLHNAKIYTVKYVRPEVQAANIVTYQPNSSVIRLMASNPNIVTESARALSVKARVDLEQRLQVFEEAYPDFEYNEDAGENAVSDVLTQQAAGGAGVIKDSVGGAVAGAVDSTAGTDEGEQSVTYGE